MPVSHDRLNKGSGVEVRSKADKNDRPLRGLSFEFSDDCRS